MEIQEQNRMYYKEILGLRNRLDILKKKNEELSIENENIKLTIRKREKRAKQRAGNKKQN